MDEQQYGYRTGQTQPKKNRRGIVALFLILAIFFCGIFSALHIMNISLSLLLHKSDPPRVPLSFSQAQTDASEGLAAAYDDSAASVSVGGMVCQELTGPCQKLYGLPAGLYVAQVTQNSPAYWLGIMPGDVLTSFNGVAVTDLDTLQQLLDAPKQITTPAELVIYQDGQYKNLTLLYEKY